MGEVFEATQLSLGRKVALKVVASELSADRAFVERFRREARAAAAIEHPNILPVYETGETDDGRLYMAMRLVRGGDLASRLREEGRLTTAEALRVLGQIAEALDAAHDNGLIHRDVKPANVLLEQGKGGRTVAYLADFGLAKADTLAPPTSAAYHTRSGHVVGTVDYMAPEQVRGEDLDHRADVYAFGCLLFTALTGAPPFRRESDYDTMTAHLNEPVPVPSRMVAGVPAALDKVVARAMAKDPWSRAHSAGALMRWAGAQPTGAASAPVAVPVSRPGSRAPSAGVGAPLVAPSSVSRSGTAADRFPVAQGAPDRRMPPTPLPPTAEGDPRRKWLIGGLVAAVVLSAALAVGAVLLLGGDSDEPFDERLARALTPLIDDNETVTQELEALDAGDSPGSALSAVRDTLESLESAGSDLEDLTPPEGEEDTRRRAERLVGTEENYLEAVGSVLNNPGSPRVSELVLLEREADEALGDLDPVASGLEGSLGGAESLIEYSQSRLSAREQREQDEAISRQQEEIVRQQQEEQAAVVEQELEFTRQIDALLDRSRPFYDDAERVVETMRDAADGDDVGPTASELINDIDGVIANRGDSAASTRAITAPTEETRQVGERLVEFFDAAQEQAQSVRECLTDVEESDLSDISSSCVDDLAGSGATNETDTFTAAYDDLRSRLGLSPVQGEF
jgi:serine/threonine-protein kinase